MIFKNLSLQRIALSALVLNFVACASQPIVPDARNVKLTREDPPASCRELGRVYGTVATVNGTLEEAIEDMKLDAARQGANYVRMEATGAQGTSASGTAYLCR